MFNRLSNIIFNICMLQAAVVLWPFERFIPSHEGGMIMYLQIATAIGVLEAIAITWAVVYYFL